MFYYDFESNLREVKKKNNNPNKCYTVKYQGHIACFYGYILVCANNRFSEPSKYIKAKILI